MTDVENLPTAKLNNNGLDSDGFIVNRCSATKIQPEFQAVVLATIDALRHAFVGQIHSIYLYGSVGRGSAKAGQSDLDVSVVFKEPVSKSQQMQLNQISKEISGRHDEISKLDLDPGYLKQVLEPEEKYRWQFWLKHCCCCIWGEDLAEKFCRYRPDVRIGYQLNSDLAVFLTQMESRFARLTSEEVGKILGKKLLRTAYLLVAEKDKSWHTSLEQCAEVAIHYFEKESIESALALANGVSATREKGIALFNHFGQQLLVKLDEIKATDGFH
ncbi:nucleotidyltransferase domain-containing protein [Vibrio hangzhouensis]|uniref:Predicted nucleotidyltransferase n=1 Tax=Vibrio hangzhouensis TaxID=462991 RepID=A0A1H5S3U4_9VIBR|nr:nucleotidyltransferase domain-containing protein [Vibrio hangzhouensis]SEF45255.1 Predicted nucleotidyltransferase [Vibrio hangzhouensis]